MKEDQDFSTESAMSSEENEPERRRGAKRILKSKIIRNKIKTLAVPTSLVLNPDASTVPGKERRLSHDSRSDETLYGPCRNNATFTDTVLRYSTDLHRNTLRLITETVGGHLRFTREVQSLWNKLGNCYQDNWFVAVNMGDNPCAAVLICDEGKKGESKYERARLLTYYFLRALMYRPIEEDEQVREEEYHKPQSERIQSCFVKFLCYVAANSMESDLDQVEVNVKSIILVGKHVREEKFSAGCILCPSLGRKTLKPEEFVSAVKKATSHFLDFHVRRTTRPNNGRVCGREGLDGEIVMTIPNFLVQVQKTVVGLSTIVGHLCLDVKDFDHWYKDL